MKKLVSLIAAMAMLLAIFPASVRAEEKKSGSVHLEGYVINDPSGNLYGRWIGFESDAPQNVEMYSTCPGVSAAAYFEDSACGYIYGYDADGELVDSYFVVDIKNNHNVNYSGSSNGVYVFGMVYNELDETMYAICDEDHPYLATVNIKTGELTKLVDIQLGTYLGLMTLALDDEGNFYALTMSALNSRLVKIDPESGALTLVGETGLPCYYVQSMTYEPTCGKIYWAQAGDAGHGGLYTLDPENARTELVGIVGDGDMVEITGLYVLPDEQSSAPLPGDADLNGEITSIDALLILRQAMGLVNLEGDALIAADYDNNGTVTVIDATTVLRLALSLLQP